MPDRLTSTLLDRVYVALDLESGALLPTCASPRGLAQPDAWRDHGDWLLLGHRLGAERIFFVGDDPVLVFSQLPPQTTEDEIMRLYRRAWSMAGPRCLFVDIGDALRVYVLDKPPPTPDDLEGTIEPIEIIDRAADVRSALAGFHRDRFESGAAFEDPELAQSAGRADKRLLRDVRGATAALIDAGLAAPQAHALIERAILVRYLEDRGVLTDRYFQEVAQADPAWTALLEAPLDIVDFGTSSQFIRCLGDPLLTQALFDRLARNFNGDLFLLANDETDLSDKDHLKLLSDLLRGVTAHAQDPLFLWAYDFSVVPTSLVSTMYELFYNQEVQGEKSSTYYTPPELVEFVLGDVLTPEVLAREPVACDPACGSGIFLVEAYRRIVRHEAAKQGAPLSTQRLRTILLERIAGCDIDESAIRLAAFSLYVAFLNYQTPQDIETAGLLPPLIHRGGADPRPAPLVVADAFTPLDDEVLDDSGTLVALPWTSKSFDVVIGNPPWTEPKRGPKTSGERWARRRKLPYGDRSPSQLFLWRTLDLLAPDGVAAVLVSAKVLFNTRTTSRAFRRRWLSDTRVSRVINFSEVRHDFFERAVAPFALIRFSHARNDDADTFVYETARPVLGGRRGSAGLARLDRRVVDQRAVLSSDHLWKIYSAGDHRDEALVARLGLERRLGDLRPDEPKSQYGYQRAKPTERASHEPPAAWRNLRSLRTFDSWGPVRDDWFETVTPYVKFDPAPALFLEPTLAVRRGVTPGFGPQARLLTEQLAFRHTIYGIPIGHRPEWEGKVALGILLSSVGRYWLFMVSGSWGTWKDEVRAEQLLDLPVRLDADHPATARIVTAVDKLPHATAEPRTQLAFEAPGLPLDGVLDEINDAVSDLFELKPAERDLVWDFWAARDHEASGPVELSQQPDDAHSSPMARYAEIFRRAWRPLLADTAELDAHFGLDSRARVLAAVFETRSPDAQATTDLMGEAHWSDVLDKYAVALDEHTANRLLSYGELRAVTNSAIIVVKRNERRLWSATAARHDAEATTAQLMARQHA